MPVDESLNVNLNKADIDLDELDKKATQALKVLQRRQKALRNSLLIASRAEREQKRIDERGGVFQERKQDPILPTLKGSPRDLRRLTKRDEKIEKKLNKLERKLDLESINSSTKNNKFLNNLLGPQIAKNIFSMGKNPKTFFMGVVKALPFLGGVLAAKEIADFIVDEIIKIDRFFKKFIDEIDNRVDAFRTLQEQAEVQAGLTQRIITTSSGSTEPRYSYNTFELFNNDTIELETKFQMTNNSGVD